MMTKMKAISNKGKEEKSMLDFETLLDYLIDDYKVNIFDIITGEDIEKDLSIDEAKDWAESHEHDFCSFEPTNSDTITINVEVK